MRTSIPGTGVRSCPTCLPGRSVSSRSAQYGPNDSVMPNRLDRAPGGRCSLRREHGFEAPGLERGEVGVGKVGMRRERGGLVGPAAKERDPLALEQLQCSCGLRLRFGDQRGAGDERRQKSAAEPAHPEERHRDVQAVAAFEAPGLEARLDRAERAAVGVDHALRRASAPGREHHDHVVGRTHGRVERGNELALRAARHRRVRRSSANATARRRGNRASSCCSDAPTGNPPAISCRSAT